MALVRGRQEFECIPPPCQPLPVGKSTRAVLRGGCFFVPGEAVRAHRRHPPHPSSRASSERPGCVGTRSSCGDERGPAGIGHRFVGRDFAARRASARCYVSKSAKIGMHASVRFPNARCYGAVTRDRVRTLSSRRNVVPPLSGIQTRHVSEGCSLGFGPLGVWVRNPRVRFRTHAAAHEGLRNAFRGLRNGFGGLPAVWTALRVQETRRKSVIDGFVTIEPRLTGFGRLGRGHRPLRRASCVQKSDIPGPGANS